MILSEFPEPRHHLFQCHSLSAGDRVKANGVFVFHLKKRIIPWYRFYFILKSIIKGATPDDTAILASPPPPQGRHRRIKNDSPSHPSHPPSPSHPNTTNITPAVPSTVLKPRTQATLSNQPPSPAQADLQPLPYADSLDRLEAKLASCEPERGHKHHLEKGRHAACPGERNPR